MGKKRGENSLAQKKPFQLKNQRARWVIWNEDAAKSPNWKNRTYP